MKEKIIAAYLAHLSAHGDRPKSVYAFASALEISESEVYASAGSFAAIEREIMRGFWEQTALRLSQSPEYAAYSARERALAAAYTWLEVLREQRSAVVVIAKHNDSLFVLTKPLFLKWAGDTLHQGMDTKEVADRLFVSDWYKDMLWLQMRGIIQHWLRDESADFEQTDAFVEKSINFGFDLMQPNFLDSGFDFIKWAFQRA